MKTLVIKNGKIFNGREFVFADLEITDGKITRIENNISASNIYDAKGYLIVPGFIDIHTHGALSHDSLENYKDAHVSIAKFHAFNGTTSYCPTFLAAGISEMESAIQCLREFNKTNNYARCIGVHVEGVFCSPNNNGAQNTDLLLDYSEKAMNFFRKNKDMIKRITLAPDVKNSLNIIREMKKLNIQISLGHDNARASDIEKSFNLGATSTTHIYNCSSLTRRINGVKQAGLTELSLINNKVFVEVIADGKHVPDNLLPLIYKMKGSNKIVFISDSIAIAGLKDSKMCYLEPHRNQRMITMQNGIGILNDDGTIAGSGVPLVKILQNVLKNSNIPLENIIKMSSHNQARLLSLKQIGNLKIDSFADINIVNAKLEIIDTFINGNLIRKSAY